MHDVRTKEADLTEGQNHRALRWEGRADMLEYVYALLAREWLERRSPG